MKVSVLSGEGEGARGSVDATAGVKLPGLQETSIAATHPLSTHILPDDHQSRGSPCWPPSGSPAQVSTWGQRQVLIGPKQSQSLLNHDQSRPCRVSLHLGQPSSSGGRQRPVRSASLGFALVTASVSLSGRSGQRLMMEVPRGKHGWA